MLTVESLCFDYPGTRALDDVGFTIASHSITALVGPNGAGKTTLLRCIAGLAEPIAGRVLLDGADVHEDPRAAHRAMGYLSDFFGLYDDLTVAQCLRNRADAQGVAVAQRDALVERAARRSGIAERMDQKAGALSRGPAPAPGHRPSDPARAAPRVARRAGLGTRPRGPPVALAVAA